MEKIRLQKFIADMGLMSRRAAAPGHAHTASITCSSAAESGRRVSGKPYICCTSVNV